MPEIKTYADAYHATTWFGPKRHTENTDAGSCYAASSTGMYPLDDGNNALSKESMTLIRPAATAAA